MMKTVLNDRYNWFMLRLCTYNYWNTLENLMRFRQYSLKNKRPNYNCPNEVNINANKLLSRKKN